MCIRSRSPEYSHSAVYKTHLVRKVEYYYMYNCTYTPPQKERCNSKFPLSQTSLNLTVFLEKKLLYIIIYDIKYA